MACTILDSDFSLSDSPSITLRVSSPTDCTTDIRIEAATYQAIRHLKWTSNTAGGSGHLKAIVVLTFGSDFERSVEEIQKK